MDEDGILYATFGCWLHMNWEVEPDLVERAQQNIPWASREAAGNQQHLPWEQAVEVIGRASRRGEGQRRCVG